MGNQQIVGEPKKLVIVGGGWAGLGIVQLLNKNKAFQITLIDRRNFTENNTSSVRFLVNPDYYESQMKTLATVHGIENIKFVQGQIEKLDEKQVISKNPINGEVVAIDYDYLVLATGSNYHLFKSDFAYTEEDRKKEVNETGIKIEKANHLLLIGGRTVGIEFLGEVLDRYPEKKITLVHSGDRLIDEHNPTATTKLLEHLSTKKNLEIILKEKVIRPTSDTETTYKTENGKTIENVDYAIWATGYTINTSYLKGSFLESVVTERNLVKVEPTLLIQGQKNIFAVGDIVALDIGKLAYIAKQHATLVAKNLELLVAGKAQLVEFNAQNAPKAALVITVGKNYGLLARNPQSLIAGKFPAAIKNWLWKSYRSSL